MIDRDPWSAKQIYIYMYLGIFVVCCFVSFISHFCFEDPILVLIVPVPGHCAVLTFKYEDTTYFLFYCVDSICNAVYYHRLSDDYITAVFVLGSLLRSTKEGKLGYVPGRDRSQLHPVYPGSHSKHFRNWQLLI